MVIKRETRGWVGSSVRGGFMPGPVMSSFPGSLGAVWGMGWDGMGWPESPADLGKRQRWRVLTGPLCGCPVGQ